MPQREPAAERGPAAQPLPGVGPAAATKGPRAANLGPGPAFSSLGGNEGTIKEGLHARY